ncbi:MAG: bacillithiol system redox-active protein YtxJ [Chitinophagaceae bacterium]
MAINWINFTDDEQLKEIKDRSKIIPQLIFKHSTRCSISSMIKRRLEKKQAPVSIEFYYLDLIKFRSISNKVADEFNVFHESPQVLLIKNGDCVYDESHVGITMEELVEVV